MISQMTEIQTINAPLFTRAGYAEMLSIGLNSGYRFLGFSDPGRLTEQPVCLLRHDVDADPAAALELARIEAELGIASTYFFMLRSPLYNLLGRANTDLVREILGLGHHLGLHLDVCFLPGDKRSIEEWAALEIRLLGDLFDARVSAVSYHQPSQSTRPVPDRLDGVVLANGSADLPGFFYLSDSNKAHRTARAPEIFAGVLEPRFHFLVHPIWWATDDPDASTEQIWSDAIVRNFERSQDQLLRCEGAFGSPRRFSVEHP